jgi:repressor LexA
MSDRTKPESLPRADLTDSQERVMKFIRAFAERSGFPPTLAEIAEGLGFRSVNGAAEHVRLLAKKGALEITPRAARGLRIVERPAARPPAPAPPVRGRAAARVQPRETTFELPLIGQVAAGRPILAEENVEQQISVDPALFSPRAHYLLRVRGDSMLDAGILPGDLVAVHKTPDVRLGQIAVVRLDDEVTVKRWQRQGRRVVLEAANPAYEPIVVDPRSTTVAVEGVVVGLLRR